MYLVPLVLVHGQELLLLRVEEAHHVTTLRHTHHQIHGWTGKQSFGGRDWV